MAHWRKLAVVFVWVAAALLGKPAVAHAEVCNLKVVTDASPDYSDLKSMIHSITAAWPTDKEKCWAMFYWNHIARRQTQPMILHGTELTDPIRQFNDYGYTMCSTISGVNCGIWHNMGLKPKFWDICNHTVCEVEYDGKFHMYDNSLSALYTLCDGVTLAGVAEIGATGACAASGGKSEPGHIARYHCLTSTGPNGFLMGADTARSLTEEYGCFNPKGLKYRSYYFNWDFGHRYVLNLKDGEVYTRYYHKLGDEPKYWTPNNGKDPESVNTRYRIRGNGVWKYTPPLGDFKKALHSFANLAAAQPGGLQPEKAGEAAQAVFKIQSANVATGLNVQAHFARKSADDTAKLFVSTSNGLHWKEIWSAPSPLTAGTEAGATPRGGEGDRSGELTAKVDLVADVNGSYEILVKAELLAKNAPADAVLKDIQFETYTQVNSKTQPKLSLGKNTIYVGAGEQTETIVFWPDLQGDKYKELCVAEDNVATQKENQGWNAVLYPAKPKTDAFIIYKIEAPGDMTRLIYGGRFYPRAHGHGDLLYSLDNGKTWTTSWTIKDGPAPWDVIHYETVELPKGTRSVLVKYLLNCIDASPMGFGLYGLRIEANYLPAGTEAGATGFKPMEVTYAWKEVQPDGTKVERSHCQLIEKIPSTYTINVGGDDLPVMESLRINFKEVAPASAPAGRDAGPAKYGYSDSKDVGGEKWVGRWITLGNNLALGKPYTVSIPSGKNWGTGDPEGKKLTDGVVGSSFPGGTAPAFGLLWDKGNPEITVDLGEEKACGVFRIHLTAGWPWWDALKREVKDKVEVLTSSDGKDFKSSGLFDFTLRQRDIPYNHMLNDEETAQGFNFSLTPPAPVNARYVKYKISPARALVVTEVQVFDTIKYEPFDIKISLPKQQ
ncbi:MAG TPA: hypothetical protein VGP72_23235 [Planctomycetota bacterium]